MTGGPRAIAVAGAAIAALASCTAQTDAAPERASAGRSVAAPSPEVARQEQHAPASGAPGEPPSRLVVTPVSSERLCVTAGRVAPLGAPRATGGGWRVTDPTLRAVASGSRGEAAALRFTLRGDSTGTRALASGAPRRQLGLKLRAEDGCNLIYVMWRLDGRRGARPTLHVSVKRNPGQRTHRECGARGYTRVAPSEIGPLAPLRPGAEHTLRAEISSDELRAWVDDELVWRGRLPAAASTLRGPAGVRSDNVALDLVELSAAPGDDAPAPCTKHDADDRHGD
jgi:hypothetical protein